MSSSNSEDYGEHVSVLLQEVLQNVYPFEASASLDFLDCTFGGGGHASECLKRFPNATLTGLDQDRDALRNAEETYRELIESQRLTLWHGNFSSFPSTASESGRAFDAVLMDLGVSSHHFDSSERGFSFNHEGPLDMRMNQSDDSIATARQILESYTVEDLEHIFREYGGEKFSRKIAERIGEFRLKEKFKSTKDLENICFHVYPRKMRHGKTHPATRVFQALRIEVNQELDVLKESIVPYLNLLRPGGRLGIITFHSLEDRIVKHVFRDLSKAHPSVLKLITKRPIGPQEKELLENRRSRSAKLRVLEKLTTDEVKPYAQAQE